MCLGLKLILISLNSENFMDFLKIAFSNWSNFHHDGLKVLVLSSFAYET